VNEIAPKTIAVVPWLWMAKSKQFVLKTADPLEKSARDSLGGYEKTSCASSASGRRPERPIGSFQEGPFRFPPASRREAQA